MDEGELLPGERGGEGEEGVSLLRGRGGGFPPFGSGEGGKLPPLLFLLKGRDVALSPGRKEGGSVFPSLPPPFTSFSWEELPPQPVRKHKNRKKTNTNKNDNKKKNNKEKQDLPPSSQEKGPPPVLLKGRGGGGSFLPPHPLKEGREVTPPLPLRREAPSSPSPPLSPGRSSPSSLKEE